MTEARPAMPSPTSSTESPKGPALWRPASMSVVIPTYKRIVTLRKVLDGFANQTYPRESFEVIVVDDGSADGSFDRLEAYRDACPYSLQVVGQPNAGPAAARNNGLRRAQGDVVLFVDDDCIPDPHLLAEHAASHDMEGLAVIGQIDWHPDLPRTPFMRFTREHTFSYFFITLPYDATFACFYTGNASVHRLTALEIGGFDQDFHFAMHEDIEFAYRLRKHGVRFVYNPGAVVLHDRANDFSSALEREKVNGRELVRLLAKHPELSALAPIGDLLDPETQQQFYEVATRYYLRLGIQEAFDDIKHYDPAEVLPSRFAEETRRWADARVETLQTRVQELRGELERLHAMRQADLAIMNDTRSYASRLERDHATLRCDYDKQSRWAADLQERLAAPPVATGQASRLRRGASQFVGLLRRSWAAKRSS